MTDKILKNKDLNGLIENSLKENMTHVVHT